MNIQELNLNSLDLRYAGLRAQRPLVEKRLMASLGDGGQQSPVVVAPGSEAGRYVLIDGHKRVRALKRLKADVVKAAVWEMSAVEALVRAYQVASGAGWNVVEEGWLTWELVRGAKLSISEVGRRLDRSKAWVSGRLGLVESLPETVLEGVRSGKIGAYTAIRHLLPFARANAADCESLAGKMMENEFRSREMEALCRYYGSAGREGRRRMLEDPARFLKALKASGQGPQDPTLSEAENRALKQLDLIGNVAIGLTRGLPEVLGYDAGEVARGKLWSAWERSQKRFGMLEEVAVSLKNARLKQEGNANAESRDAVSDLNAAPAGAREP